MKARVCVRRCATALAWHEGGAGPHAHDTSPEPCAERAAGRRSACERANRAGVRGGWRPSLGAAHHESRENGQLRVARGH